MILSILAGIHQVPAKGERLTELARIDSAEVKRKMESGEPVLFIDTRNQQDWGKSDVKLPGALRIHYRDLEQHLDELPHDRLIVTYCT